MSTEIGPFEFGPEVQLEKPAFVDPTARIFGRVSAGEGSSFWFTLQATKG